MQWPRTPSRLLPQGSLASGVRQQEQEHEHEHDFGSSPGRHALPLKDRCLSAWPQLPFFLGMCYTALRADQHIR